jgi:hypothetical protein
VLTDTDNAAIFLSSKKHAQHVKIATKKGEQESMSLYQREKSWYYDFMYRGQRYRGCIGPVSKTIAKEIVAKKKAEAVEGRYELPSKKPSPRLDEFAREYFAYS